MLGYVKTVLIPLAAYNNTFIYLFIFHYNNTFIYLFFITWLVFSWIVIYKYYIFLFKVL
jgi:hypothetical protein